MKLFALLLVALVAVTYADNPLSNVFKKPLQEVAKKVAAAVCMLQVGANRDAITKLREGNLDEIDYKTKCFGNCFLEKFGVLVNGEPQEDVSIKLLGGIVGEEKIKYVNTQCHDFKGADNCETYFLYYKCHLEHGVGFLA